MGFWASRPKVLPSHAVMVHPTNSAPLALNVEREPYMANTFAPFGFRQFGQREGTAPTAGMDRLLLLSSDTNSYYTGDTVVISSQSLVAGYITLPTSGTL